MKERQLFVLVPSLKLTGPIKGAVALCNGMVEFFPVTLVHLKHAPDVPLEIDPRVRIISLAEYPRWKRKYEVYRELLADAGKNDSVVSFSLCLSADALNFFMAPLVMTMSSVRANNLRNYRYDYGLKGILAACIHLLALNRFGRVTAMSHAMADQLKKFGISNISIIGNFVDESVLEQHRIKRTDEDADGITRFIFLGSLSQRKRPDLLVDAVQKLAGRGNACTLDVVGDGPMRSFLEAEIAGRNLARTVTCHGELANPYAILQKADCLVIPSESEGVPRSALEALYYGIPCILRDVDGNRELITPGRNGYLFREDWELAEAMATLCREKADKGMCSLLPDEFRQGYCLRQYRDLILDQL